MYGRFSLLLLLALPAPLVAQSRGASDPAKAKAALAPFTKVVGQWEGDARVMLVPGQPPQVVRYRQDITMNNAGTILKLVGIGRSTEPGAKDSVILRASGTLSYDNTMNKLRLIAQANGSDPVEADIQVKPDTLIWGIPVQGGRLRFTVAYGSADWHQIGQFILQNGNAIPAMEMRLKKIK